MYNMSNYIELIIGVASLCVRKIREVMGNVVHHSGY